MSAEWGLNNVGMVDTYGLSEILSQAISCNTKCLVRGVQPSRRGGTSVTATSRPWNHFPELDEDWEPRRELVQLWYPH
jgi:hypothetical protein